MGLALLTTLYGVALANLLFKPIAIKFERRTEQRVILMNVIMEGVLLMARGHTPAYIREFLRTFVARYADELHMPAELPDSAPGTGDKH
jgi:chemotaxis protein MotA